MARVVYLFMDTNVFVQCRPFEQLDWSEWHEFDEVHLVVTRPVQSEIDKHKNKGNERLARRTRRASKLLREIIIGDREYHEVRTADPAVKLFVVATLRPSSMLSESLDYSQVDDKLVGIIHEFVQQNPGVDARILTHDTGPMASARMVGIKIAPVPDEWLEAPEPSETDRKIRSLEAEIARLKETEPVISVSCLDSDGCEKDKLELEVAHYEPLSSPEVESLLDVLKRRFPIATDFGSRVRTERLGQVFKPAPEDEIEQYYDKYAKWLAQCEDLLRNLHQKVQDRDGRPIFMFSARNEGSRPAADALVTIRAKGQLSIMPPPYRSHDDDDHEIEMENQSELRLPNSPAVPRGTWTNALASSLGASGWRRGLQSDLGHLVALPIISESVRRSILPPRPHDPNEFYYKPDRPSEPCEKFALECKQWRHDTEPMDFIGEIHFDPEQEQVSGAIECRIHAQNLSKGIVKLLPVSIKMHRTNILSIAEEMVSAVSR